MSKNRSVRFVFGGSTVLVASSGDQVSFNTTVLGNGVVLLKDNHFSLHKVSHDLPQTFALNQLILLNIKMPFDLLIGTWRDLYFARQAS
jgi:hypothetical protein